MSDFSGVIVLHTTVWLSMGRSPKELQTSATLPSTFAACRLTIGVSSPQSLTYCFRRSSCFTSFTFMSRKYWVSLGGEVVNWVVLWNTSKSCYSAFILVSGLPLHEAAGHIFLDLHPESYIENVPLGPLIGGVVIPWKDKTRRCNLLKIALIWGSDFEPHPQPQNSLVRISVFNQASKRNSY